MPKARRFPVKLAAFLGIILLIGLFFTLLDLSPNLEHLDAKMLTGSERGHYYETVTGLAGQAEHEGGTLTNVASSGSVENLERLAEASDDCNIEFALVQDGIPAPEGARLTLIARLIGSETVFFLGKNASAITRFEQLRGLHIGLGREKSGTDHLARRILESEDFAPLGMTLTNHGLREQLDKLEQGELDLGVFVVDEDAALVRAAIRERGLEIASFDHVDAVARQHRFLSTGTIGAGHYDPIRVLPPSDRKVFQVGTLILGNGCADHPEEIALLTLLSQEIAGFIDHNRQPGGSNLFPVASSTERFLENNGPGFADVHAPWLVSIMPPSNWVYVVMVISIFINLTTTWHRFRLWRLDANTEKADTLVRELVGEHLTPREMLSLEPKPEHATPEALKKLEFALVHLDQQRVRSRRQANSLLVPMGSEWTYRFSEEQMEETITAMRRFRDKAKALAAAGGGTAGDDGEAAEPGDGETDASSSDDDAPPRSDDASV